MFAGFDAEVCWQRLEEGGLTLFMAGRRSSGSTTAGRRRRNAMGKVTKPAVKTLFELGAHRR